MKHARLTRADKTLYTASARKAAPLSDEAIDRAWATVSARELVKGEHFLRAGDPATEVAVVASGLLREYFDLNGGSEGTKAFIVEGEFTGSLADLISGRPSRASIVAEEPSRVLVSSFAAYRELPDASREWEGFALRSAHALLLRKAEREYELLGLTAEERYATFADRFPGLEARIAAKHVASYLGITPVHLSRLRRRRRELAKGVARGTRPRGTPRSG